MKNSIYELMDKCINEFQELLLIPQYINKKKYEKFIDKYNTIFNNFQNIDFENEEITKRKITSIMNNGYKIIESRNKKYVNRKLIEEKQYFDNIFNQIDENILLDEEQRNAIITDEDYSLIIAGAGSGKTTTMAAKVKYLIEKCHVNPNKIILLSFTKKATEELDMRINEQFKLNVPVMTFHKLGMHFLRELFNEPISIVNDKTMYNYIKTFVTKEIYPQKDKFRKFIKTFENFVHFDDDILNYNTFDEYFGVYASRIYEQNKDNLTLFIEQREKQRLKNLKTIDGQTLKSQGEVMIANYLYKNGFDYEYEKTYPFKMPNNHSYIPDFTVNIDCLTIYIEYYGMTKMLKNGHFTADDINIYNNLIYKKKQLHKRYGTDLIEICATYENKSKPLDILNNELLKRNLKIKKRSEKEVFYKIIYTSKEAQYIKFIKLATSFITKFKEKGYNNEYFKNLIDKTNDNTLKEQLKFLQQIYNFYNKNIHDKRKIDFNDMINYAYLGLEKVKEKYHQLTYDYLIIDEYQDISKQRYNLAKKLSDIFKAKIVAVGDDWQAIYKFSGSDVDLFTNFYNHMGYAEISKITKTYRNSQELIDVAGTFISKNKNQFSKRLISDKHICKPIEIMYYNLKDKSSKVKILGQIIVSLFKQNHNQKILLLGRYASDIDEFINTNYFRKGAHDKIICNLCKNADIDFLTIHKSKGLGYDNVILLNGLNETYGFPSQVKDNELLKLLDEKEEDFHFAEERRLFYVALTRTKEKIYILAPYLPFEKRSEFVVEIKDLENVEEKIIF